MPAEALPAGTRLGELVAAVTTRLREAGSPSPRLDAELLISHVQGRDRAWLHTHPDEPLTDADAQRLARWIGRRAAGEPIAYIRGFKDWLSLRIATDARALIPRPETELLAEVAVAELAERLSRDHATVTAWEVGTGSGAIATALAVRFRTALALGRMRLTASDVAAEALELAAENLAAHGAAPLVGLACGDLLEPMPLVDQPTVDVLIANLPYLTSDEVARREGSIGHEPAVALDGGPDGLSVVRRLLAELPRHLAPGGVSLLEIGAGQAAAVHGEVEATGLRAAVSILPDLAGIGRVARIARL